MRWVVVRVRSERFPGLFFVPGTYQEPDAEDTREAALGFSVQLALDAFALKQVLEDLRLGKVIRCVDHHWLVCVHGQDSFAQKKGNDSCTRVS
jgi:hypothetical protein